MFAGRVNYADFKFKKNKHLSDTLEKKLGANFACLYAKPVNKFSILSFNDWLSSWK